MLRIIAGELRGRRIATPPGRGTRPTADQVREGMFNTLTHQMQLDGARVWDLYAGSGALGIEALSRGAAHVVFVEQNGRAAAILKANLKSLGISPEKTQVVVTRVERWLKGLDPAEHEAASVQLVLLDPPYADTGIAGVLAELAACPLLTRDALLAVESARDTPPQAPAGLEPLRVKRYGDTQVMILGRTPESPGSGGSAAGPSSGKRDNPAPEPPADP